MCAEMGLSVNQVIIYVEVNSYWMKEQAEQGKEPFSEVKRAVLELCPAARIATRDNKLEISDIGQAYNAKVRQVIRNLFTERYGMSIADGDYNLTAKICPVRQEIPERTSSEETKASDSQPLKDGEEKTLARKEGEKADGEAETSVRKERENVDGEAEPLAGKERELEEKPAGGIAGDGGIGKSGGENAPYLISLPELERFLAEYDRILKNGKRYGLDNIAWDMNLLLSMDSGYGITSVNERLAEVLEKNGFVFNSKTKKAVVEYVIPEAGEAAERYFQKMLAEIAMFQTEEKQKGKRNNNAPFIFCIDISEWLGGNKEKKVRESLQQLLKVKGSFLYVFRIPYVEEVALRRMKEILADLFLLRTVVIPPFSNEELVSCLKYRLEEKQVRMEEPMDDLLEKLIALEKQDGSFDGLKAVNRLATDIVYHLLATAGNEKDLTLTREKILETYVEIRTDIANPREILEKLCGMENVKQTIDEMIAQIKLYKNLKESGKKLSAPAMHMRFVGNPGTGKTTVARLLAQIFKREGILNKGYFYEIKARDLCGRYVGETAPKTSSYCRDALGSVLFIDEAYTLYRGEGNADYGREAIETLITEMENNRDNLVIIMAGYQEEMDEMLKSNPGLKSRMPYEIEFRNYTKEELVDIFFHMLGDNFAYTDGFDQSIRSFFAALPDSLWQESSFSNARMVRNLYERIWSKAAYRKQILGLSGVVLQEDDVQRAVADKEFQELLLKNTIKIGF